jgi:hypothetical protein
MKIISDKMKVLIVLACTAFAVVGFMLKLPPPFRRIDQELHALFFFMAAAFFNILFQNKKISTHLLIFGMLFLFSTLIEFAQDYSNAFFHRRIHGNFDPEDLKFNLLGLFGFSAIWMLYYLGSEFLSNEDK